MSRVVTTLLTIVAILVLASIAAAASGSAAGTERRPASGPALHLGPVSFSDPLHGWVAGEVQRRAVIFATSDGGHTWSRYPVPAKLSQLQFLDALHGWTLGVAPVRCGEEPQGPACRSVILRTSDGGRTWARVLEGGQCVEYAHLQMINGQDGWATSTLNFCASHSANSQVVATRDDGRTWHIVFRAPVQITSLHFGDRMHGWVAGDPLPHCVTTLFRTADGGRSWQRGFHLNGFCLPVIDFVDARTGWLHVADLTDCSMGGCGRIPLYRTVDGGAHWRLERPGRSGWWGGSGFPGQLLFVNRTSGWMAVSAGAGPGRGGIVVTHDGGRHWVRRLDGYDVVDGNASPITPAAGWVTGCRAHGNDCSVLVHTSDGGRTWQVVRVS